MPSNTPNQTLLPVEKGFPERFKLPDSQTSWDLEVPDYAPRMTEVPNFHTVQRRLYESGLEVVNIDELDELAMMCSDEAVNAFGERVLELRNPLGRTGINGSGIYYVAGESKVADMIIVREHPELGPQVALARVRNKWAPPGGFCDNEEEAANRRLTSVREAKEEILLDMTDWDLSDEGPFIALTPVQVKANSRRATDLGWMTNQVTGILLPDYKFGDRIAPGDPAEGIEDAQWFTPKEVQALQNISKDHLSYIAKGFDRLLSPASVY